MLQESNSTLRLCIKVRKTIFKSTLRTVDAVESVSYCVQQDGKSSRRSFDSLRVHVCSTCMYFLYDAILPRAAGALLKMVSKKSKLSANIAAIVDLIGGREQARRA